MAAAPAIPDTLSELRVPIGELKLYPGNARRGDVAAIARSLVAHGQYRPVVVNRRNGEVLAGNHTLQAALELGWDELAATYVDVDDEQARRIVLVDNRASDLAGYDDGALAELLASLPDLEGTGWQERELDRLLSQLEKSGADAGRDTEPGPRPARPATRPGDLYRLGPHRLVCGDSTVPGDVDRALAGEQAEMVWTDPPYGVDYVGKTRDELTMRNDHLKGRRLYELVLGSLGLACERTRKGGAIYVAHGDGPNGGVFRQAFAEAGWQLHETLVWVKSAFALSRLDYHAQHESILYGWRPGAPHRFRPPRTETSVVDDEGDLGALSRAALERLVRDLRNELGTTVVREDKPVRNDLHPTMKPVALVARHVANSSRAGDVVYEPFGGSGSTLLACDNLGRSARVVELDPGYCDVIVNRWRRHTGLEPELERPRQKRRARAAV